MADDTEFIDVHFPSCKEYVRGDLGALCFEPPGTYADAESVLSWSEIDDAIEYLDAHPDAGLDYLIEWILNQGREGSCVGNATIQAVQIILNQQFGIGIAPRMSAMSMYKQIGRSPSSGANVSHAMRQLRDVGILPLDNEANRAKYKHVFPATGFRTRWPENWQETAKLFRGFEFLQIRSTQEMFSALCKGHPVVVGREGHSICYCRPMKGRKVKYANSWGSWGGSGGKHAKGFGIDTQRQVEKSSNWAFAVRAVNAPQELAA